MNVELLPFGEPDDLELLKSWLLREHVVRWWGDPARALDEARCRDGLDEQAFIACDGELVGYLRWHRLPREELDELGFIDLPTGSTDVDIFLSDLEHTGKGIGPKAIDRLADRLREEGTPLLGMTTSIDNEVAIAAYAKAGFTIHSQYEDPIHGACHVMIRTL